MIPSANSSLFKKVYGASVKNIKPSLPAKIFRTMPSPNPMAASKNFTNTAPVVSPNVGIVNKGNTCYINSVLQCFCVIPEFWSNFASDTNGHSIFVSSFLWIMSLLKTSKSPSDPSPFLRFLKQVLIKAGNVDFNILQQQDVCEVLSCVLDKLCSLSRHTLDLIKIHVKNTITCSSCLQSNILEDPCNILEVPVCNSIQEAVRDFIITITKAITNTCVTFVPHINQPL